jgi:tetratricopeptide (TPR) repeat protein
MQQRLRQVEALLQQNRFDYEQSREEVLPLLLEMEEEKEVKPGDRARIRFALGQTYFDLSQYEHCVMMYDLFVKEHGGHQLQHTALYNRGLAHGRLSRPELAIADFISSLTFQPDYKLAADAPEGMVYIQTLKAESKDFKESKDAKESHDCEAKEENKLLQWSVKEVSEWVCAIGPDFQKYKRLFVDNAVDGLMLPHLDDALLQELGIDNKFHRLRIGLGIDGLVQNKK